MKDERIYQGHIRDAIHDIEVYTSVNRDAFVAEWMRHDAVIRKLEIIGEAVKQLSTSTKECRPEIPWKQIAGMRDRLTHDYFTCGHCGRRAVYALAQWLALDGNRFCAGKRAGRDRRLPADRSTDVYPRLLEQLKQLPGVVSAAAADSAPLGTNMGWNIYVPGYVPAPNEPRSSPCQRRVARLLRNDDRASAPWPRLR